MFAKHEKFASMIDYRFNFVLMDGLNLSEFSFLKKSIEYECLDRKDRS